MAFALLTTGTRHRRRDASTAATSPACGVLMRVVIPIVLLAGLGVPAHAQDSRRALPEPVPPLVGEAGQDEADQPAAPDLEDLAPLLAAQEGEVILLDRLAGVVLLAGEGQLLERPVVDATGVDASRAPLLRAETVGELVGLFLDRPTSAASLDRLRTALRALLQAEGHPFTAVYVPEQDITEGIVQIVVREAVLDDVVVDDARWFSEGTYTGAIGLRPGGSIDLDQLQRDVAWLNRHPFRHVTPVAEPGSATGTTRIVLRATERVPLRPFGGYDNTGTDITGESRVVAGLTWGNALGLGHLLTYQVRADPRFDRSTTHALNYQFDLPWRHSVAAYGAYSDLSPNLAAPFNQAGRTWQAGLQYGVPLPAGGSVRDQGVQVFLDFKASDNTLEFSDVPVVDNETHVAQVGLGYALTLLDGWGGTNVTASVYHSPGGLTSRNDDEFFDIARAGATADYTYGRIGATRQTALGRWLQWLVSANVQVSNRNLLGSEQMVAGGAGSVRGYEEGYAFGDNGVLVSNTLSAPVWRNARHVLSVHVFQDSARVWSTDRLPDEPRARTLHGAGAGIGYNLGSMVALQVNYGSRLSERETPGGGTERGRAHVQMRVSY